MRHLFLRPVQIAAASAVLALATVAGAQSPAPLPGTSLLRFPNPSLRGEGSTPPMGQWGGVGLGTGTHHFSQQEGMIIVKQIAPGIARLQYGTSSVENDLLRPYWGAIVEASVEVRGKIDALAPDGTGAAVVVEISAGATSGTNFQMAPKTKLVNGRPIAEKTTGTLEWTKLRATFRVPANTTKIAMLMYLMNAQGELQWRDAKLVVAPAGTTADVTLNDLPDPALAQAAAGEKGKAKYEKNLTGIRATLKIPAFADLYEVPADLATKRPRLYFNDRVTAANLAARSKDPAFTALCGRIRAQADALIAYHPQLPAKPKLDTEDPLRGWADGIAVQCAAVLIASDAQEKEKYLQGVTKWIESIMSFGVSPKNLPLAQTQTAFALAYDWLNKDLPEDLRARMRVYMIAMARRSFDMANPEVNWVFATQYLANHNWFNYTGRLMTVLALWGENDPAISTDELKQWMDLSIENLYIISQTHPHDGLPIEGFLYGDYGMRPYADSAANASSNLKLKFQTLEHESIKNMGRRLHAQLPNGAGFMVYSDSKPSQYSGGFVYRLIAAQNRDPIAQAMASLLERRAAPAGEFTSALFSPSAFTDVNAWRSLFWSDPAVPEADIKKLPLQYDATDLGLYLSRSDWNDQGTHFLGLRCGPSSGTTASSRFGVALTSGHCYPEQGNLSLYSGAMDIIPGCDYARTKQTTNHSLAIFEGRDAQQGLWVGQVGEGGAWFGANYAKARSQAKVIRAVHAPTHDQYLCDIGGLYWLSDKRADDGTMFPEYRRSITYLRSSGVAVIVDRVRTPQPRSLKFRLLTGGKSIVSDGADWLVTFKTPEQTARIRTLVNQPQGKPETSIEQLSTWGKNERAVLSIAVTDATEALLGLAVGPGQSTQGLSITTSASGLILRTADGESIAISLD